jgi:ABC-2 type transport system ATP-binding protein
MIEFDNVTRKYGHKVAVDGLDLTIPSGELFALLGPNGAGKTTTIKMIVGLMRPSSGTVRVCGHDVGRSTRDAARLLGYVPDVPYLYDKLTGREFLQFIADMFGLHSALAEQRIGRQIESFRLENFVDDLTESYSHGMKQRLAFAAALVHGPRVLVIDEPMVGLDPRSVRVVKDLLRAQTASGLTIFMSTHLLSIAEEIADRVGVLEQGKLRFLGTLSELRRHLATEHSSLEQLYLNLTADRSDDGDAAQEFIAPDVVQSPTTKERRA